MECTPFASPGAGVQGARQVSGGGSGPQQPGLAPGGAGGAGGALPSPRRLPLAGTVCSSRPGTGSSSHPATARARRSARGLRPRPLQRRLGPTVVARGLPGAEAAVRVGDEVAAQVPGQADRGNDWGKRGEAAPLLREEKQNHRIRARSSEQRMGLDAGPGGAPGVTTRISPRRRCGQRRCGRARAGNVTERGCACAGVGGGALT